MVSAFSMATSPILTTPPIAYYGVQRGYEVGHNGVGIVQTSEDRDDVGARVGVLLGQGSI
jgi:hypothetical protein